MKSFEEILFAYSSYHTKKFTKQTHLVGVPIIVLSMQMLLSWLHISLLGISFSLAWIAFLGLVAYYLFFDVKLGLITGSVLLVITLLAQTLATAHCNIASVLLMTLLFVVGWFAQLLGHYHEGKKPAIFENMMHALIAPLFLVMEVKSLLSS